jgi:membrane protein YdbS with pleckstrin-like domain
MAFPRKLLAPGEGIVLEAHPNWSILVPRVVLFLVILAGCVSVVVAWAHAPLWMGWVLLGVAGVFLLYLLAKIVVWRSTTLVLTNQRVVYRTGALRRLGREIPLDRVQDVTYSQSILERMVGAGSLTIESAGAHGDDPFPDIRHPAAVQSLINRLITQPGGGLGGSGGRNVYGAPSPEQYQQSPQPQYPQQQQPNPQQSQQQYQQPNPQQYQQPQQPYPPPQQYQQPQQPYPPPQPYQRPQPYQQQSAQPSQPPPRYQPARYQPPQYTPPQYTPSAEERPSSQAQRDGSFEPPGGPEGARESRGSGQMPPTSSSEQLQHLSELHRLGVITDAEYEQKRRELIEGA